MNTQTDSTGGPAHDAWPEGDAWDKDAIVVARDLAQHKSIERLQRWVEALEAAVAAEPVTATLSM